MIIWGLVHQWTQLRNNFFYIDGHKHEMCELWYDNGFLMERGSYDNSTNQGLWEFFDNNGTLLKIIVY